ncbi:MAG: NAD(P)/FAD-dependent oxidoreductase [Bdellovibrionota bacterium]
MPKMYSQAVHPDYASKPWDVIIIGSGLGGMTSGTLLARAGKRVLMLERHYMPGGFTHTFKRKGFEWDVGVHYVGQVAEKNSILRKIFDYVSEGQITWAEMGTVYDRAIIEGDIYDFVSGTENQIQNLLTHFPLEEKSIRAYFSLVKSTARSAAWFFGEKTMPKWMSRTIGRLLRWKFNSASKKTTYDVLKSITSDEKLISVLCAQCGDYGLEPKKSSFGIHAVVVDHYLSGGSYPVGGAKKIHEAIIASFEKSGGTLLLKAEVMSILVDQGKAVGVEFTNGERVYSDIVISNAGVMNTFKHLLGHTDVLSKQETEALSEVKSSTAHVCLYVGLEGSDTELALPKNNIWIYDDYDFNEVGARSGGNPLAEKGLTYISFPSAKDPAWAASHPGKATVQVISACAYDQVRTWEKESFGKRSDEYESFKRLVSEKLTRKLIEAVPQIEGRISFSELSTPLSTKHFMGYKSGEIYGLEHSPKRFDLSLLRPQTKIPGLYLTGQDVVTVGVGGALYSGVLAATKVLNKSVMLRVLFNRPL